MVLYIENFILVLSTAIAGSLMLIGAFLTFFYAKKKKYSLIYLFSLNWFLQSAVWFLVSLAHFFYSITIMSIAFVFQCVGITILIIFLELISKERVNPAKIIILTTIETLYIVFTFMPGSMEVIPKYGVHVIGICRFFQILTLLMYFFLYFFWSFKTWRKAPLELKSSAKLLLMGSILFSIIAISFYVLGSVNRVFNPIGFIVHSIGALITIIVIRREPKIIYILPFKAIWLSVYETNQGLSLFSHGWIKQEKMDKALFAGVIQGIQGILKEILDKGGINEIQLDQAMLIIHHDRSFPIASVLITTNSSKSLRQGLKQFNEQFIAEFGKLLLERPNEISQFSGAIEIVNKVFEFIPEY